MWRTRIAVVLALAVLAGCGDDDGSGSSKDLRVSAATSLKAAFTAFGADYDDATVRFSFAGSDQLAGQIRAGVRPDLFAAANAKLPRALFAEGLVEQPVAFARNRLVLAVPAKGAKVTGLDDLADRGVTLAIGGTDVPIGDYTRTVLGRLPAAQERAILTNVRSEEPDVGGIVGKIAQGAVDAGFVYATDVRAAGGRLRAIVLPASLEPEVVYEAAVVKGARSAAAARTFLAALRSPAGAEDLRRAGFLPPPPP
jgi:molybdate transport system substrate-binding protein